MEEHTTKIIKGPYLYVLSAVLFLQMSNCNIVGQIMSFFTIEPIVTDCDEKYKIASTGHCNIEKMCADGAAISPNMTETLDNWSVMFKLYCPKNDAYVNNIRMVYFVASMLFPTCISSLPDYFGRMRILNYLMILMLFSYVLMLIPSQIAHFVSMFLLGGLIMIYNVMSQIVAEFYDVKVRGIITGIFCAAIPIFAIGFILLFYFLKKLTYFWYILIALQIVSIVLLNVFYVESPIWLISSKKKDECIQCLSKLAKWNGKAKELQAFKDVINDYIPTEDVAVSGETQNKKYNYLDVFRYKSIRSIVLKVFPYWTAVLLFDFTVFLNLDKSGSDVYFQGIDVFASCTASALIAGFLADWLGRKAMLIISIFASCIPYVFQPYFFERANDSTLHYWVNMVLLFAACISIETAFTVVIIYSAEAFPTSIRSTASGCLYAMSRIGSIVSPYVVGGLNSPQYVVSLIYFLTLATVWSVPETKGRDLGEEIEEVLVEREKQKAKDVQGGHVDLIPEEERETGVVVDSGNDNNNKQEEDNKEFLISDSKINENDNEGNKGS